MIRLVIHIFTIFGLFISIIASAQEGLDLSALSSSQSETLRKLEPSKESFVKFATTRGFNSLRDQKLTGYIYPETFDNAVLENDYDLDMSSISARDCATYIIGNVGSRMMTYYSEPTAFNKEKVQSELLQAKNGMCLKETEVLQASLALLDEVNLSLKKKLVDERTANEAAQLQLDEQDARHAEEAMQQAAIAAEKREREAKETAERVAAFEVMRVEQERANTQHIIDLKANKVPITSAEDAVAYYDAHAGEQIVVWPLAEPDHKYYVSQGALYKPPTSSNEWVVKFGAKNYFVIITSDETKFSGRGAARINGAIRVVGKYVNNTELTLVGGNAVTAPVFDAIFVAFPR